MIATDCERTGKRKTKIISSVVQLKEQIFLKLKQTTPDTVKI